MEQSLLRRPHFFFTTAPMPCPYIEGRMERKLVTELVDADASRLHDTLSRAGFRRSHSIAYTPACPGCTACIPVRVIVKDFEPGRTQKRTIAANKHLIATETIARATAEQFRLFSAYQNSRHTGSDMALMGFYDYRAMVEDSPIETGVVEFREPGGRLVGGMLADHMDDGLSAVYSFFDTTDPSRGIGTYMILWMIERARALGLPYVYLGYWISESAKMAYKTRFQPLEAFVAGSWGVIPD